MRAADDAKVGVQSGFAAEAQVMEPLLLDGETELEGQYKRWGYPVHAALANFIILRSNSTNFVTH
jgi:hypothetical protein